MSHVPSRRWRATLLLASLCAGVATAAPSPEVPPATSDSPRFEQGPCPFSVADTSYRITCGTVAVTENRHHDDGRRIRLAVAVVHAEAAHPEQDPVVYLDGGPGQSSMELVLLRLRASTRVRAILKKRDYIFWDQRGVGRSEPHLCTSLDTEWFRNILLGYSVEEQRRHNLETFAACRQELQGAHTDIAQFGTATSAADLEDLRRALGIHSWNLDGGSYGSRLGLVAVRDAPGAVRSMILDGVMPIDAPRYNANAWRFARVLDLLDTRCAADPACHARYPDLAARTYRLIASMKQHPLIVPVTPGPAFPVDHIVVNDRVLASGLFGAFYDTQLVPLIPAVIEQVERGNGATFEALANSLLTNLGAIRQSLNVAVDCHDAMPLTSFAAIHQANAAFPRLAEAFEDDESFASYCEAWNPHGAPPEELLPTVSSIPTLMLVGDFDPVTPPAYAQQVRNTLSAATVIEFPNAAHGGKSALGCVADAEVAFLANPGTPLTERCTDNSARLPFLTQFLLLPGLTRLVIGLRTHAHFGLIATTGLAFLLPVCCLVGLALGAARRRWGRPASVAGQPAPPRTLILWANVAALAAFALLAYEIAAVLGSNPNLVLLGLPGTPYALICLAVLAGLLAAWALAACLKGLRDGWRLPLNWLGGASALAYLGTFVGLLHR